MSQSEHTRTANRQCARCGKPFYAAPSRVAKSPGGGRYCSRTCQTGSETRTCRRCGEEFTITEALLKRGGGVYCGAACRKRTRGECSVAGCARDSLWDGLCQWHYNRRTVVKLRYGLSLQEDEQLRAAGCAICGGRESDLSGRRRLHIDHDHRTGIVRGALCHGCNTGLGAFGDDPARMRAAARYLEKHRST